MVKEWECIIILKSFILKYLVAENSTKLVLTFKVCKVFSL